MGYALAWIIMANLAVTFCHVRLNIVMDKKRKNDLSGTKVKCGDNMFGGAKY